MVLKTIHFSQWIWQDYTGAKWSEINKANTHAPTGDSAYCTVKGKDSKSNYRPKSLFYHYQIGGIDSSKYKLNSVTFTLVLGRKCSNKVNPLPSIKCFVGDNNAPYRKEPLCTVSTYSLKKLEYDFDTYIIEYKLSNVTIADLKNLIVEVDWKRSLINGDSTVRVNRARVNVDYELKTPKWSIYDWMAEDTFWDNETTDWKITAKNTGYKGDGEVDIVLPKGATLVSSRGEGSFNPSTKKWTFNANKGETRSRYFKLKFTTVGNKTLTATNVKQPVNKKLTRDISVIKSQPKPQTKDDTITYTVYDYFANEEWQYFDVQINGVARNHPTEIACFPISMTPNCTLYTPLVYPNVYLLSESSDTVYQISGSYNDRICLRVEPNEDFEAHLRIFFKCDDSSDTGTVYMTANGTIFSKEFPINAPRKNIFIIDDSENISRDKAYVVNSVNIGATDMWTIRSKFARHNFFDDKKDLMEVEIEPMIAYIGVVPLSRCHKADVTADSKNTLIENRYLNRAYYGKKGDYSEDIKMTLRIPWYDVATLQGLVEMDKPIPIDTIPHFPDGDPLNHRGWAEIYEVTNIKKINDLYYECDVGVKYLSHDINTRFSITETKKITEANIKYYLALIHNYNEDLLDIFTLNYYEFWTTLEDANGDMIGTYDIEPQANLKMNRDLNRYSTYDIVYRNTLPMLMSEDYDGNWEMAIRVLDKSDGTMLFEHSYNNFKHYDYDTDYAVNTADATSKYLNGSNYDTLNFEKVGLGYDNLAPLIEDRKIATHFNTMESVVIDDPTEEFEIFLLDDENKGISNEIITVKITDDENYSDTFKLITDIWGRGFFKFTFGNGTYNIAFTHDETDTYRACKYNTEVSVQFEDIQYHFEYQNNPTVYAKDYPFTGTLLDENNEGVSGMLLHYSFKDFGSNTYGYERTVMTDSNGVFTVPIDWVNGTKWLRVMFKGFVDNGTIYEPVLFEEQVNINLTGQEVLIEADDVTIIQGEDIKTYNIILKNNTGELLRNKPVNISFYNNEMTYYKTVTTNNYGVASIPMYLTGDSWKTDIHFLGDETYRPTVQTHTITIQKFERKGTYIETKNLSLDMDLLQSGEQDYYTITLLDDYEKPVVDEPVQFIVENGNEQYVNTVLRTDENGMIEFPFISHSENVNIVTIYDGCVRYQPCENFDEVVFANKTGKADVSFTVDNSTNSIKVVENSVSTKINENDKVTGVIVTKPSNLRQTNGTDMKYYTSLNTGTFNVTVMYQGNDTYYPTMRTVSYTHNNDTRLESWDFIESGDTGYTVYPPYFDEDETDMFYGYPVWASWDCGLQKGRWYWLPYTEDIWNDYTIEDWRESDLYSSLSVATQNQLFTEHYGYDKWGKWGFDAKMLFTEEFEGMVGIFLMDDTDHFLCKNAVPIQYTGTHDKEDSTLTVDGFARDGFSYQDIKVSVDSENATLNERINEYYILKLTNTSTLEQLFFYSYLVDKTTVSQLNFLLSKGTYELEVLGQGTHEYKMTRLLTTGTITLDSDIPVPPTTSFNDSENYVNLSQSLVMTDTGFMFSMGG